VGFPHVRVAHRQASHSSLRRTKPVLVTGFFMPAKN
jgi:hypothetical protein